MKKKNLLMTTIAICGFTAISLAQLPSYVPSNGLVGWWPFNGNANDQSDNGNNGVVNGANLITDRNGIENCAYSFDGFSSKIIIPNSTSNSIGLNDYTLSAWVNTSSTNDGRIISKGSSGCITGYMMRTGGQNSSKVYTENAYNYSCYVTNSSLDNINDGIWHMVTVVITRSLAVNIFIDGILDSQYLVNSQFDLSNNQDLFFGFNNLDNSYEPFLGALDDIGIWNRALSEEEITSLYYGNALGINEDSQFNLFSGYPNPAQNEINVNTNIKLVGSVFTIYDNIGKAVKTGKLNSVNTTIELNDLSSGIYNFSIEGNRKQTFKVIKE